MGLSARVRPSVESGQVELLSPMVGLWRVRPEVGQLVTPGGPIGSIEVLGRLHPLTAPTGASGIVVSAPKDDRARLPVAYGDVLLVLDPTASGIGAADPSTAGQAVGPAAGGLVFVSPMSGRFYARSGPDKPPFVAAGQSIRIGDSVCLLEVMKTFNRVTYGGDNLPAEARIKRVVPADGDDLNAGDPILELEVPK